MLWMPEEDAFWCLCAVIEDILGCSYFDERMVLPQVLLGGSRLRAAATGCPSCVAAIPLSMADNHHARLRTKVTSCR